jgi:hypothetical protein
MPKQLRSFRRSVDLDEALSTAALLREAGFDATVRENSAVFDVTFTAGIEREHHVLLPADQFGGAEALLEEHAREQDEPLPADHYLRTFDNEELLGVLREADAWSPQDRVWAAGLLHDRGITVDTDALHMARQRRMAQLAEPEPAGRIWLATGFVLIWLGGIGAMVIGWSLMNARKVLPDGRSVYRYSEADRRNGRIILLLGGAALLLTLAYLFSR